MVQAGGLEMGIPVSDAEVDRMMLHAAELIRWNRKTNLTAITETEDIAVKHVLDSLAPLPHITAARTLLDIGSGGGFPGIVLKIMRPDLHVTLIDAARKKVSFLSHVVRTLGLQNISALHARAETLATDPRHAGHYDVIVCRALCALNIFAEMAIPLLSPEGLLIALKGKPDETQVEMADVRLPGSILNSGQKSIPGRRLSMTLETIRLPFLSLERSLVLIRTSGNTLIC